MTSDQLDARTEDLIDATGLPSLLESIARVSMAKAEFIRTNWQDPVLAKGWENAALVIEAMLRRRELAL